MKRYLLTITLLTNLVFTSHLLAQQEPIEFEHLTLEDGLSQASILGILQDRQGFMWFGTEDGLNKYDGYKFTVYRHQPDNVHSLSNNWINALHEDKNGNLWIGTEGGGLNKFDPKQEVFTHFRHDSEKVNSLSHDTVLSIYEDNNGILWIGTDGGGLNQFDPKNESFKRYLHDPQNENSLSHNKIWSILQDQRGMLWVGTYDGLNRLDRWSETFTHYHHEPNNSNSLTHNTILSLYEDKAGILWIGTEEGGLDQFDPLQETFVHYRYDPKNPTSLSHNAVWDIYEDSTGILWIGTHGGLNKLNRQTKKFEHYQHDSQDTASLTHDAVWSIYEDRTGILWVGALGGVNKYDRQGKKFRHYRHYPRHLEDSLSDNNIRAIFEDQQGIIWIGTYGGGLNRFDRQTGKFQHYLNDPQNTNSLIHNNIRSIQQDRFGMLWIGTYGGGLDQFNPTTNTFKHYQNDPKNPNSLSDNNVRTILEDKAGNLWFGTFAGGFNQLERETETFRRYRHDSQNPNSLINDDVRAIYEDREGMLWIGTSEGLDKFDRQQGKFIHYFHDSNDSQSLSSNNILSIYEDKRGTLWVGTLAGLNRFDRLTKTFTSYREADGLANDVIYGILEDEYGKLWLSTNKGLAKFNPRTETFRNYDIWDGLQNNEFNIGAYWKSRTGELIFGGINGFNLFRPDEVKDNPHVPPVFITDFQVFNHSISAGNHSLLTEPIEITKAITLSYRESVFSFEFVALNYTHPHKNQYAYKLKGFHEKWNEVNSNRRFATYTNLNPGTYEFIVKGANNDGIWNEEGASIKITITPPPWRTWWAYTLYILAVVSIIFHYVRKQKEKLRQTVRLNALLEVKVQERTRELHEKNEALVLVNQEKNEFLGIAAHDLKNPLSAIKGYAEEIMESFADMSAEEVVDFAKRIHLSSKKMFDLITNLLDVNAIEAGKMNVSLQIIDVLPIVQTLVNHYAERALAKNITVQFEHQPEPYQAIVDENTTHQVLDNLISNAVKYSPPNKNITIRLRQEGQHIRCEIQDQGPGLSTADQKKLFGKFNRLTPRPTGGEHSTGLGLFIVKKLIEAMNGKVWCESELGKGATFIAQFQAAEKTSV